MDKGAMVDRLRLTEGHTRNYTARMVTTLKEAVKRRVGLDTGRVDTAWDGGKTFA